MVIYDRNVLVVRHLPQELTKEAKIDLLKFLGASEVKCLSSENKKSSLVFAKFDKEGHAEAVLKMLHQKDLLGQLISVEFARGKEVVGDGQTIKESDGIEKNDEKTMQRKLLESFQTKLNSWINTVDLTLPPPVHLRYSYPPPQLYVMKNICKALSKVPKFYTQVLHLMNKMNLPCPFVENYVIQDDTMDLIGNEIQPESSEESELESDGDDQTANTVNIQKPTSLHNKPKIKRPRKLITPVMPKKSKFDPKITPDQVFDIVSMSKKNIKLHIPANISSGNENEIGNVEMKEDENKLSETVETEVTDIHKETDLNRVITEEELAINRVPAKDFHLLPVFKNYQPGLPSSRLYLKNLAKTVQESDLNFIFKRYVTDDQEIQESLFDIKLMQEGRMKGQAFIMLQSTALAEKALKETNGFMLKGKPIVVQYAKSQKPK
ncbi:RNA-binding protein 40 [Cimex lectularius]|uniref:RNA-binding region-containing protein 3 n=1 Tax=Cimex lectularius TaxID=79782 RepID=A0A8I6RBQ9_CIMLE|nr:RNA-binding protein 40 [Cimex lectularius]